MSLSPGFILTDEYGDMIGLTSLEMHVVVQAHAMGRLLIRWISSNGGYDMLVSHVYEHDGEGDTVIVSERDADEMRRALEAVR